MSTKSQGKMPGDPTMYYMFGKLMVNYRRISLKFSQLFKHVLFSVLIKLANIAISPSTKQLYY